MKKVHEKTIDPPELAAWLSGCVALLMHFSGQHHLGPEMVGAMITAALMPVAMVGVRLMARALARLPDEEAGE
jgi:predicted benzoate:H+ symporter BenE